MRQNWVGHLTKATDGRGGANAYWNGELETKPIAVKGVLQGGLK